MALRPEDPSSGFRHSNVVAFINEKMARHTKGPEFYLENISLSWEEVEDKLRAILEDSEVPSEVKEACTWGSLALGVRFAHRQGQLQNRRVQWLQGFAKLHRSAAMVLASNLTELKEQQEMECNKATYQLRITQTSLAEVQRERDMELASPHEWEQGAGGPGLATAGGVCTEGAGEEEEEAAVAAAGAAGGKGAEEEQRDVEAVAAPVEAMAPPMEAGAAPMEAEFPHVEAGAASMEPTEELERILLQLLGDADKENYTYWGQKEEDLRSAETATSYFSGTMNPWSRASPEPLPVQLPASFTYSYSSPFSSFSDIPTISPPQATVTAPVPTQLPSDWGAFDTSLWSDGGPQRVDPQEHPRDRRYSEPHQQRRPPVYRRPGDWDCPWCNAVNFSRRDTCFDCGRGIWLQKPH
uniref:Testis expressed 13A n=1 Tax=Chlorocebus sabaeus TaxID=60711 RepID=A0A0D9RAD0_CHLSB